jgi:hypothetical protein
MTKIPRTALWLLAACFLLSAGCDELPDSLRDRIDGAEPPHVRVFSADRKATYAAALEAVGQIGFRFERGGPATGDLEAISGLATGDDLGSTRQFSLKARLNPTPDGGTEVQVWIKEIVEGDSENHPGFATESPLRDTPLYEAFFHAVQQGIGGGK